MAKKNFKEKKNLWGKNATEYLFQNKWSQFFLPLKPKIPNLSIYNSYNNVFCKSVPLWQKIKNFYFRLIQHNVENTSDSNSDIKRVLTDFYWILVGIRVRIYVYFPLF